MALPVGLPAWASPHPPPTDPPVEQSIGPHIRILPDKSWLVLPVGLDRAFPGEVAASYDDGQNLNWACQNIGTGGVVRMIGATYNCATTVTVPETVSLLGPGAAACVLAYSGSGAAVYHHGSTDSFSPTFAQVGAIDGFCIDGASAGAGAIGLDVGDGWGHNVGAGMQIRHFNQAGSIGMYLVNRVTWTEKCRFAGSVQDCTSLVVLDVAGGLVSHMYSVYDFMLYAQANQNALVFQGNTEPSRCSFRIHGNMKTSSVAGTWAAVTITGGASSVQCHWELGMECDGTDANAPATFVTTGGFTNQEGIMAFLNVSGNTPWAAASLGGNWNFQGPVIGDSTLSNPAQPALPASGTTYTNVGNAATVYVAGGTVTGISVMGQATGLTSGAFRIPAANGTIKLTYSVAPTTYLWVWDTQ